MKIGVIDVGTRATRLLIGDTEQYYKYGFQFKDFFNRGEKTEAGLGLVPIGPSGSGQYELRIEGLSRTVSTMRRYITICKQEGILDENIHIVATEVFRRGINGKEAARFVSRACNHKVMVLHPDEEAQNTLWSVCFTCRDFIDVREPFVIIEQGGGSLQLAIAILEKRCPKICFQDSIPELGTVLLRQNFQEFRKTSSKGASRYVGTVNREVRELALKAIDQRVKTAKNALLDIVPTRAFALGKVITNFVPGRKSSEVHGERVQLDEMVVRGGVLDRYEKRTIESLYDDAREGRIKESEQDIADELENIYGMRCYEAILTFFKINCLYVCGAGMRYGIFFRIAEDNWTQIREFVPE